MNLEFFYPLVTGRPVIERASHHAAARRPAAGDAHAREFDYAIDAGLVREF